VFLSGPLLIFTLLSYLNFWLFWLSSIVTFLGVAVGWGSDILDGCTTLIALGGTPILWPFADDCCVKVVLEVSLPSLT
jgi:hypothetical protein